MAFVKHTWTDDLPPALCAEELNRIEDGIEEAIAGGGAPTDASYVVVDAEAGLSAEYPLGTTIIMRGVAGSKPAASKAGLIYIETDGSFIVWRDNGSSWDEIARGEAGIRLAQLADRAHSSTTGRTADDHHAEAHGAEHQDGGAQEFSVAALSGLLKDDQHVLDAEVLAVAAALVHKDRHKSGGADALTATDLIEAIVKRIQTSTGPTTLTLGAIAIGEYVKRDGATLVGGTPAGGAGLYSDYIHIRDEKASGTNGGTFTAGAWRTRDLTVDPVDTGGDAELGPGGGGLLANQIRLEMGTYRCLISCPAFRVVQHKARLYNITDGSTILVGTSEYCSSVADYTSSRSFIVGRFTLAAQKVLEVQHRSAATRANTGFGVPSGFGVIEVYAEIQLWKEA